MWCELIPCTKAGWIVCIAFACVAVGIVSYELVMRRRERRRGFGVLPPKRDKD
jgi:hypothetical protein